MFSPVVIFCYNRSVHLCRLIDSIKKNKNYKKHIYYFFVDGPKDKQDGVKIEYVLKVIKNFVNVKKKSCSKKKKFRFIEKYNLWLKLYF